MHNNTNWFIKKAVPNYQNSFLRGVIYVKQKLF